MLNNVNLEAALRMYYERLELGGDDIRKIFGNISPSTITRLKKQAREQMVKDDNPPIWHAQNVNTASAFRAWGLDPADLEKRLSKLRKLGLLTGTSKGADENEATTDNNKGNSANS